MEEAVISMPTPPKPLSAQITRFGPCPEQGLSPPGGQRGADWDLVPLTSHPGSPPLPSPTLLSALPVPFRGRRNPGIREGPTLRTRQQLAPGSFSRGDIIPLEAGEGSCLSAGTQLMPLPRFPHSGSLLPFSPCWLAMGRRMPKLPLPPPPFHGGGWGWGWEQSSRTQERCASP